MKQADTVHPSPIKSAPKASVDNSVTDIDAALNSLQVSVCVCVCVCAIKEVFTTYIAKPR